MAISGRVAILGFAGAIVVGAIVAGLVIVGSPTEARLRRLDERRVRDLVGITHALNQFWTSRGRLPASLNELVESPGTDVDTVDPVTGEPYRYEVVDGKTYDLCADFQRDSDGMDFGRFWSHGAGRRCFRLEPVSTR